MEKYKQAIIKIIPNLSIVLFSVITLIIMLSHGIILREDEAHAWTIAGNANLFQLIDLMKVEGHCLIWYLIIAPFAKFNILYPYSMQFINWVCVIVSIVILWKCAPFNNLIKLLITFSSPFLLLYAVQPRCYGIGILFLFLSMAYFKKRFEKPYLYVVLLMLAANTSIPACIASLILGLMFVYDLIIEKQNNLYQDKKLWTFIISIVVLNTVLFYFQFIGFSIPDYEKDTIIKAPYYVAAYLGLEHNLPFGTLLKMIFLWLGTVMFPILFNKSKHALTFFVSSELITLMFFTFVYEARIHHVCMMYIFAIISYWIYKSEISNKDCFDKCTILFTILALYMVFVKINYDHSELYSVIDDILSDKKLTTSNLYTNLPPITMSPIIPIVQSDKSSVYNMNGVNLASYEGLKNYFNKNGKIVNPDNFAASLNADNDNYIVLNGFFISDYIQGKEYKFKVSLYKNIPYDNKFGGIHVYKVSEVQKISKN